MITFRETPVISDADAQNFIEKSNRNAQKLRNNKRILREILNYQELMEETYEETEDND